MALNTAHYLEKPTTGLDCDPSSTINGYNPCSEFWFPDGNLILVAGNYAFKVHRGQLERHSEVFSDMLSLPLPLGDLGSDHVQLHDDPVDVYYLLKALYDGVYVFFLHGLAHLNRHNPVRSKDRLLSSPFYLRFFACRASTSWPRIEISVLSGSNKTTQLRSTLGTNANSL